MDRTLGISIILFSILLSLIAVQLFILRNARSLKTEMHQFNKLRWERMPYAMVFRISKIGNNGHLLYCGDQK